MVDRPRKSNRRRVLLWVGAALTVCLLLGAFALRPSAVLGVDGDALQFSVGGFLSNSDPCSDLEDGAWSCGRYDRQMSGEVSYRVKVNDLGCWQATRTGWAGEGGSPKHMSGCVTLLDYVFD